MPLNQIQPKFKQCNRCGQTLPITEFYKTNATSNKPSAMCKNCVKKRRGYTNHRENKSCALFLGVHVAEQVLSRVFKDVKLMPPNNPGYDFICNHGKKIDVKSACIRKTYDNWSFYISHNTTADYFLCIAFDNRDNLTPLHLWLIPGKAINRLECATISKSTLSKWDEYKLDINKIVTCCDNLKQRGIK